MEIVKDSAKFTKTFENLLYCSSSTKQLTFYAFTLALGIEIATCNECSYFYTNYECDSSHFTTGECFFNYKFCMTSYHDIIKSVLKYHTLFYKNTWYHISSIIIDNTTRRFL